MKKEDLQLVSDFLKEQKIDPLNTRAFKREGLYEITVGSIETKGSSVLSFRDKPFKIIYGEFATYLEEVVYYLGKTLNYCANDCQREMIQFYIDHFRTGSIELHKES